MSSLFVSKDTFQTRGFRWICMQRGVQKVKCLLFKSPPPPYPLETGQSYKTAGTFCSTPPLHSSPLNPRTGPSFYLFSKMEKNINLSAKSFRNTIQRLGMDFSLHPMPLTFHIPPRGGIMMISYFCYSNHA